MPVKGSISDRRRLRESGNQAELENKPQRYTQRPRRTMHAVRTLITLVSVAAETKLVVYAAMSGL
jgi:hypothetical protein